MEAEADQEFKLKGSVLNLTTRKQPGSFLQLEELEEDGMSSSLQSFLCSMLEPEAVEDWRTQTPDIVLVSSPAQPRLEYWEAHSSLPDVRLGSPWCQASSLTRPVCWHAGAQNLQPASSLGSVVECGSGETRGHQHLQHLQHTTRQQNTELMVRGDQRAGVQPPVRRTSSTSSSSRHEIVAADKTTTSEMRPRNCKIFKVT